MKLHNRILHFLQKLGKKTWFRRLALWIGLPYLLFVLLHLLFPLKVHLDYAQIVTDKEGKVLHAFLSYDEKWRMKLLDAEISEELEKAFLFKEDRFFYWHPGVNPLAVVRAAYRNITSGRRTSGASTITMQVARMLEPRSRTYRNKIKEMFRALQLEFTFSKREILRLYLNLVPYGGNIEGIKSASEMYFRKPPHQLSLAEIATLVVIPNQPSSLSIGKNIPAIEAARDRWLKRFADGDVFEQKKIEDALSESLQVFPRFVPRKAPHLAIRLRSRYPTEAVIPSYLSTEIQQMAERLVENHVQRLYGQNIKNAAAIVIDNHSLEVVAYVGSAGFHLTEDAGQVDGVKAVRAPGSTLKPLLYGLAIDKGLLTPNSSLLDVPTIYGTYQPENYTGEFQGRVPMRDALIESLNVPAVRVLEDIKSEAFIRTLSQAGFKQIEQDESKLGLSMVLGGCGARLEELAAMYAAFANEGTYKSIRYSSLENIAQDSFQLLSPAASYIITEVMTELSRPDLPLHWNSTQNIPRVAWKTGTSYGRRDAWSLGYHPRYTVGVWVGNFSGEGVPDLYGAGVAAPLLFNIFNELERNDGPWFDKPDEVVFRESCAISGDIPQDHCQERKVDMAIAGISPYRPCQHLQNIHIAQDSSISYCTHCLPDSGYTSKYYHHYEPELLTFFHRNQIGYQQPPPHNPNCERVFAEGGPRIISPADGLEYLVEEDDSGSLMLSCAVSNEVHLVYWYVNDRFLQRAAPDEPLFIQPPPGKVKISCSDDKGRNVDVFIQVKRTSL